MMNTTPKFLLVALVFLALSNALKDQNIFSSQKENTISYSTNITDLSSPWIVAGSKPNEYFMGIDSLFSYQNSKKTATIKSKGKTTDGFGTIMQSCRVDKFIGKRVKMTGMMKSENVEFWAGFWLRIDAIGSSESLSFDNMHERAIKGTTNWTKYEIVLDVPNNASQMAFGALLSGDGQIWFDNINFEEVTEFTPVTKPKSQRKLLKNFLLEPSNLSFEQ